MTPGGGTFSPHVSHSSHIHKEEKFFKPISLGVGEFEKEQLIMGRAVSCGVTRTSVLTEPCGPGQPSYLLQGSAVLPASLKPGIWAISLTELNVDQTLQQ